MIGTDGGIAGWGGSRNILHVLDDSLRGEEVDSALGRRLAVRRRIEEAACGRQGEEVVVSVWDSQEACAVRG